jgi:hypothetical protein
MFSSQSIEGCNIMVGDKYLCYQKNTLYSDRREEGMFVLKDESCLKCSVTYSIEDARERLFTEDTDTYVSFLTEDGFMRSYFDFSIKPPGSRHTGVYDAYFVNKFPFYLKTLMKVEYDNTLYSYTTLDEKRLVVWYKNFTEIQVINQKEFDEEKHIQCKLY